MLKFNYNTFLYLPKYNRHLNTSYVKVQLNMKKAYEKSLQNLNTSYVKVQFIVYLMNWSSL